MSETIYLGSGKTVTGQFGEFYNVTLNLDKIKKHPQVVEDYKGNKFVRLRISKKEKTDEYGKNVLVVWNDPNKIKTKTESSQTQLKVEDNTGLPF
tara:strand:- start:500 stop:784 length:285 start_codon:yes stop_codon:yes gene_type:complete